MTVVQALNPKNGQTVQEVAQRIGKDYLTTRVFLIDAVNSGQAKVVGKRTTGKRGRPANLYARA
jgi:response regulator of citrate/malate metabolism